MSKFTSRDFTKEEYETYQKIKPMLAFLYPVAFLPSKPLPLKEEAFERVATDPYLSVSEEEVKVFFELWQTRREYTQAICREQRYFDEQGRELGEEIPTDILLDRARILARIADKLDFNSHKRPRNGKK